VVGASKIKINVKIKNAEDRLVKGAPDRCGRPEKARACGK
jgi:hypothetical protein